MVEKRHDAPVQATGSDPDQVQGTPTQAVQIEERDLDDVNGGLLLPAVQKVREASARMSTSSVVDDGGGPRVKVLGGSDTF